MSQPAHADNAEDPLYRWQLQLRMPPGEGDGLTVSTMTAAEQMFFVGAPLAHVVAYEKLLKIRRLLKPERSAARLSRLSVRRALLA